jgi:hypothetical protein
MTVPHPQTAIRQALRLGGYSPIPVNGKNPDFPGWQHTHASEDQINDWSITHRGRDNTGILTRDTPALDIDILIPDAADAVYDLVREHFEERGYTLARFGQAPKRATLFRTDTPFPKITRYLTHPNTLTKSNGPAVQRLEFLCDGQQIVVAGVHPDTGRDYSWHGGDLTTVPRAELPYITEEEAISLIDDAVRLLVNEHGYSSSAGNAGPNSASDQSEFIAGGGGIDVDAQLAAIAYGNIDDTWWLCMGSLLRDGMSATEVYLKLLRAAEGSPDCQDDPKKAKWSDTLLEKLGRTLSNDREFVAASLPPKQQERWHAATREGRKPRLVYHPAYGIHVRGYKNTAQDDAADAGGNQPADPPKPAVYPRPFSRLDFTTIPQREWLYGHHYMRQITSATIGPGGSGKSSLDLVEAIAMATGRNLLGEQPLERLRVWYHNGEDPMEELERRVAAICVHYKIDPSELSGFFFLTSGVEMPIKIAGDTRTSNVHLNASVADMIINGIRENSIDVFIADPLITLHSLAEAENHKMDPVLREFARIAYETNCSIELAHHTRKKTNGQEEYTTADARGASAIIDAVRSARTINGLSLAEAGKHGIDEFDRLAYFKVDKGKANMTRQSLGIYMRFESVELPNGPSGTHGDDVGVVVQANMPTTTVRLTEADIAILVAATANEDCAVDPKTGSWFAKTVARHFGWPDPANDGLSRSRAEDVIRQLKKAGLITQIKRRGPNKEDRHPRFFWAPDTTKKGA